MNLKMPPIGAIWMQYFLIVLCIAMACGIVGIFYLAQGVLASTTIETDHSKIEAQLAQEEISRLKQLQVDLNDSKVDIDKTARIVAESQKYMFQDQVISDVTTYATQAGVNVLGFDFGAKPGENPPATPGTSKTPRKTIVVVRLDNNIPYTSFLSFLKLVERNITKVQLTGIALQPNKTTPNLIVGPSIELEVYLR